MGATPMHYPPTSETKLRMVFRCRADSGQRLHNDWEWFYLRELSGRVLDSRPRGRGFEPYWRHCAVVLEQDTFILA